MSIKGILRGPKEFLKENWSTWAENGAGWTAGKFVEGTGKFVEKIVENATESQSSPPARTPTAAVTVTHQIKHKSFLAALAGAIAGAVVAAVVAAAVVVAAVALAKVIAAAAVGTCIAAAASASAAAIATGAGALMLKLVVSVLAGIFVGDPVKKWVTALFESDIADDGPVAAGSANVWIEGRPAGRAGRDPIACVKHQTFPLPMIAEGSKTVAVNGHPLARIDDMVECGAPLKQGASHVLIGGPTVRVCHVRNEFAWWQRALLVAVEFVIPPTKKIGDLIDNFWKFVGKKTLKAIIWGARTTLKGLARLRATFINGIKSGASWLKSKANAFATGAKIAWQSTKNYINQGIARGHELATETAKVLSKFKAEVTAGLNRGIHKGVELAAKTKDALTTAWDKLIGP